MTEGRCPVVAAPPQTDVEELSARTCCPCGQLDRMRTWLSAWTAQPSFSAPAPASFTAAVSAELDANNDRHATRCRASCPAGLRTRCRFLTDPRRAQAPPGPPPTPLSGEKTQLSNQTEHGMCALRTAVLQLLLWVSSSNRSFYGTNLFFLM
jgi:hypothetical protein